MQPNKIIGGKMKNLEKSLSKIAGDLMKVAKKAETIAVKLDTKQTASPKQSAAKTPRKQPAKQPTAVDTAFGVIKRYKKGVNIATIMQKTGYDTKKIHNLVYKLKKQGKIKSETKGVYVKV
jgi:predicted Rossmann fold nucleotide-binding protein DprA/Smf involved in DNA uptake